MNFKSLLIIETQFLLSHITICYIMHSREVVAVKRGFTNSRNLFVRWLAERKELLVPLIVLFVVVDPLITFIGTNGFNISEGNHMVSKLLKAENGWMLWLIMKIVFCFVGILFLFLVYLTINTLILSETEREKATLFKYGAWSFIICFLFMIILDWISFITLSYF